MSDKNTPQELFQKTKEQLKAIWQSEAIKGFEEEKMFLVERVEELTKGLNEVRAIMAETTERLEKEKQALREKLVDLQHQVSDSEQSLDELRKNQPSLEILIGIREMTRGEVDVTVEVDGDPKMFLMKNGKVDFVVEGRRAAWLTPTDEVALTGKSAEHAKNIIGDWTNVIVSLGK